MANNTLEECLYVADESSCGEVIWNMEREYQVGSGCEEMAPQLCVAGQARLHVVTYPRGGDGNEAAQKHLSHS